MSSDNEYAEELTRNIWSEARVILEGQSSGHSLQHSERVAELCLRIAEKEKEADPLILQVAAILHDIGIPQWGRKEHARRSAEIAGEILEKTGFPKEKREEVLYAIETHRFSDQKTPETVEARILQDADRLDALGAIGIARCFAFGGRENRRLYDPSETPNEYDPEREVSSLTHIREKLLKIKDNLHTENARRIAEERHCFMLEFVERMTSEIEGKK